MRSQYFAKKDFRACALFLLFKLFFPDREDVHVDNHEELPTASEHIDTPMSKRSNKPCPSSFWSWEKIGFLLRAFPGDDCEFLG
jgi:hypothetical protein